jgi:hypothetical protein
VAVALAVLVDGGKGGGSRDHGRNGSVVEEGGGEGGCKGGQEGSHEGGREGGCKGGGRGVLIFDLLLIILNFSQTIIISYLQANHILCHDVIFFSYLLPLLEASQPHPLQRCAIVFVLTTIPRSKPTTSFVTMCFFCLVTDAPLSH